MGSSVARHGRLPTKLRGGKLVPSQPSKIRQRTEGQGFFGPLCPSDCTASGTEKSTKAYSNYETEGSVKGSRRTIAYQVRFEDVDDAYDGMCQGTLEARSLSLTSIQNQFKFRFTCQLEPGESAFGVHAGEGLTVEDAVAPLPLPVLQQGVWPTPPFQPTPTDKPKTPPKKIDDKENKDKNGEGSKVAPATIDDKGKDGSKVAPATIDDKGKGKNGEGSKVAPKTIDDKGKDKSGVEGSGVPWVPIIAGVGLLSACSAFFIRRSRRVAQFADTA